MRKKSSKSPIDLDGNSLTLEDAVAISQGASISIANHAKKNIEASRKLVSKFVKESQIYGVNTGFGFFANQSIKKDDLLELQKNLLRSHAAGYGNFLTIPETRLAMALRLNVLVKGYTGVRYELCQALLDLFDAEIYPCIPEYGSVGASGDLAPLAHLALPLIGEGLVSYKGKIIPSIEALKQANLKPITLIEKEGLGLINGTQIMLSIGCLCISDCMEIVNIADKIVALTFDGLGANPDALHPLIHKIRGQLGQIKSAANILNELKNSYLFDKKRKKIRLQDPYSLRCAPQVHGPSHEAFDYAKQVIERELNAATDNPLVFVEEELIISGGNFHGQPLAYIFDIASIAVSELSNISERRLELLLNPNMSHLTAFLSPLEGVHSGYMALQYLSASLVNENKILSHPACTDSIPGNVGIEDHVSMGMTAVRKLKKIVENTKVVLAIELIAAAQAVDLAKVKTLGVGTKKTYETLRKVVPTLIKDRIVSEDVKSAMQILKNL